MEHAFLVLHHDVVGGVVYLGELVLGEDDGLLAPMQDDHHQLCQQVVRVGDFLQRRGHHGHPLSESLPSVPQLFVLSL